MTSLESTTPATKVSDIFEGSMRLILARKDLLVTIFLLYLLQSVSFLMSKPILAIVLGIVALLGNILAVQTYSATIDGTYKDIKTAAGEAGANLPSLAFIFFLVGIFSFLGLVLLIIPGIVVITLLQYSTQALIVERLKGIAALKRSKDIVWQQLAKALPIFLTLAGIAAVISIARIGVEAVLPAGNFAMGVHSFTPMVAVNIALNAILQTFQTTIYASVMTLSFYKLRNVP